MEYDSKIVPLLAMQILGSLVMLIIRLLRPSLARELYNVAWIRYHQWMVKLNACKFSWPSFKSSDISRDMTLELVQ